VTPQRLERLKEIFDSAIEILEPEKRSAFLDIACGADSRLRVEVEQLLLEAENGRESPNGTLDQARARLLPQGTRLGPYEILDLAGTGAMSGVYRARDTRLDRVVAIKVLAPQMLLHPNARMRFEREARAVASLSHPNICALYDIGYERTLAYLVLEYLEGETLAARLTKGALRTQQVLQLAMQLADALDTAHRHNVIHRDLKPGNIMLTKTGAKLLDFSIAKIEVAESAGGVKAMETASLTEAGAILGTLQYMAPEQLEGTAVDARTDIFALGAVIYEMATGRKAFPGKSQASVIAAILDHDPPPITAEHPKLEDPASPALDHVVGTCLEKKPEDRWQSARDLLIELKWILNSSVQTPNGTSLIARYRQRERWLSLLVAGVFIAFLVTFVAHLRRSYPKAHVVRFSIEAPENIRFADVEFAGPPVISPDGSQLAFVGFDASGKRELWLRPLDAPTARPLSGTTNARFPFWSPDSRYLAFFADGKLKKTGPGYAAPQTLCDAPDGRGGSWGTLAADDGGDIVFAPDIAVGLSRVSPSGGDAVPATVLDQSRQELSHRQPTFLPDGRHFLFVATSKLAENNGIFIGDIRDRRNVHRLMRVDSKVSYAPPGYLLFVRDSNLMARAFDAQRLQLHGEPFVLADYVAEGRVRHAGDFSISNNDVLAWRTQSGNSRQIAWFDRNGKQMPGLDAREYYFNPRLSPDGGRIAVTKLDESIGPQFFGRLPGVENIWLLNSARGDATRLTFGAGAHWSPIWSPDGRRIIFGLDRPPEYGLYVKQASGVGAEELLLKTARLSIPTDWSRDGRFIIFSQLAQDGKWDISILSLVGDRKIIRLPETESDERYGQFSPDSHWVAYSSEESGRFEVYVRPFSGRPDLVSKGKWQVSTGGGYWPRWRRDGKELYFNALDGKLMVVTVKSSSTFEAGVPEVLFDPGHPGELAYRDFYYDVWPDGQRFLISRMIRAAHSINICLNCLLLAKK
jgi:serine/threonine protein kinase